MTPEETAGPFKARFGQAVRGFREGIKGEAEKPAAEVAAAPIGADKP